MRCSEIMKRDVLFVGQRDDVKAAARKMRDNGVGFLPVLDEARVVAGVVTDRDLVVRLVAEGMPTSTSVNDVMTRDVVTVREEEDVRVAEERMAQLQKSRILVIDDRGRLTGVISLSDIAVHEPSADAAVRTLREVAEREAHTIGPLSRL